MNLIRKSYLEEISDELFDNTAAIYPIPVTATDAYSKRGEYKGRRFNLFVSEDKFYMDEWKELEGWIKSKFSNISQISFRAMIVSEDNIPWIRKVIFKDDGVIENIQTIIFHNFVIQNDEIFNEFCLLISEIRNIARLRITKNELSTYQIERLMEVIDPSIRTVEIIDEPESRSWSSCKDLINTPVLNSFSLLSSEDLRSADFILGNKINSKITKVRLGIHFASWNICHPIFKKILSTSRITSVKLDLNIFELGAPARDVVDMLTPPNLTSLKMEGSISNYNTYSQALASHNFKKVKISLWSAEDGSISAETLSQCSSLQKLKLHGKVTWNNFDKLTNIIQRQLSTLHLHNTRLQDVNFVEVLKNSVSLTELSITKKIYYGYYVNAESELLKSFPKIENILQGNSTLKSFTFQDNALHETFVQGITTALMTNKTLTHLDLSFPRDTLSQSQKYFMMFTEVLRTNTTLVSLHLHGNDQRRREETTFLEEFKAALVANQTLTSLSVNYANGRLIMPALEDQQAIRTLNFLLTARSVSNLGSIQARLASVLKVNRALTSIHMDDVPILPPQIQISLIDNRNYYWSNVNPINCLIAMICLRKEAFTVTIPLDIWMEILSRVRFPYINIDFGRKLLIALEKYH